jgi:predicted S18 family serine protease
VRRVLIACLLLTAACSEPPRKEIDQAQAAIDAARAAGGDTYAADEYHAAADTLQKARASVDQRDYRQALSYAIDARQRAIEVAASVAEAKAKQKADADRAFKTESDRVTHLESMLREDETAKVPAQQLRAAREAVDAARASLQEPRRLLQVGNYADATTALSAVREQVDLAAKEVEAIAPHGRPAKRRH